MRKVLTIATVFLITLTGCFSLSSCDKAIKTLEKHSIPDPITLTYVYNDATGNNAQERVTIEYETLADTTLVVPERENFAFLGWYADWLFTAQVSNERGEITMGNGIFHTNSNKLYAKWLHNDYATYEILMVYVTEFAATLERYANAPYPPVAVDYKMTDIEKRVCEMVSLMLGQYLNALLNGLVVFQIDTYFTTEILGINNTIVTTGTYQDTDGTLFYEYGLFPYNIPEIGGFAWSDNGIDISNVGGILPNYRTVFTTFCMNDWKGILHETAGMAKEKYASIHMEAFTTPFAINPHMEIESMLNLNDPQIVFGWENIMMFYIHEFTHTIELQPENWENNSIDFHGLRNYYAELYGSLCTWDIGIRENSTGVSELNGIGYITEIEIIRLFLTNQINIPEYTASIPFSFWKKG